MKEVNDMKRMLATIMILSILMSGFVFADTTSTVASNVKKTKHGKVSIHSGTSDITDEGQGKKSKMEIVK